MRTELDPQVAAVVEEVQRQGVPEWHAISAGAGRRVEDEVFPASSA